MCSDIFQTTAANLRDLTDVNTSGGYSVGMMCSGGQNAIWFEYLRHRNMWLRWSWSELREENAYVWHCHWRKVICDPAESIKWSSWIRFPQWEYCQHLTALLMRLFFLVFFLSSSRQLLVQYAFYLFLCLKKCNNEQQIFILFNAFSLCANCRRAH